MAFMAPERARGHAPIAARRRLDTRRKSNRESPQKDSLENLRDADGDSELWIWVGRRGSDKEENRAGDSDRGWVGGVGLERGGGTGSGQEARRRRESG